MALLDAHAQERELRRILRAVPRFLLEAHAEILQSAHRLAAQRVPLLWPRMHEPTSGLPEFVDNPSLERYRTGICTLGIGLRNLRRGSSRAIAGGEWQHVLLRSDVGEECDVGQLDLQSQIDRVAKVSMAHAVPPS